MLFLAAFLGGVLTIASPCILPVLPFVFTRTGQPFRRSGLPLLAGMAVTFAVAASLAAVAGGWVVRANQYGRWLALAVVFLSGLALLLPGLAARLGAPFVALGGRMASARSEGSPGSSLLVGAATGMLWAPCAGPILGLVLTGAAIRGANAETTLLLLTYAAGAAVSLAAALLAGGRAAAWLRRSPAAAAGMRRALGGAVAVGALAIAFGLDTGLLARWSTASTTRMEEALFDRLLSGGPAMAGGATTTGGPAMMEGAAAMMSANPAMMSDTALGGLPIEGPLPPLDGATEWLNSEPLTTEGLRGRVVLVDFWTYSCINCLRTMPYVKAWAEKYRDQGLVVVGVHAPEFAFEKDVASVQRAVRDLGITHPVALDNDFTIWRAFGNRYWPAHYLADAAGNIRYHHFGEGDYDASEQMIQQLLMEAGRAGAAGDTVAAAGEGVSLPSDLLQVLSPETYLGYERTEHFASAGGLAPDESRVYAAPPDLGLNTWALEGAWTVGREQATLDRGAGRIVYDPSRVTYGRLLQIYFSVVHDPTQLNRQGPDVGPQYRSTIFPVNPEQREIAERYIADLDAAEAFPAPIATTLEEDREFFPAEAYHQDFMFRNPSNPYIVAHDLQKVRDLERLFPEVYRDEPVLVSGLRSGR